MLDFLIVIGKTDDIKRMLIDLREDEKHKRTWYHKRKKYSIPKYHIYQCHGVFIVDFRGTEKDITRLSLNISAFPHIDIGSSRIIQIDKKGLI